MIHVNHAPTAANRQGILVNHAVNLRSTTVLLLLLVHLPSWRDRRDYGGYSLLVETYTPSVLAELLAVEVFCETDAESVFNLYNNVNKRTRETGFPCAAAA